MTPRAITLAANDATRVYGDANPALTWTVGGSGLVNGDALSGALTTMADLTSNVADYAITQGTLAASSNYAVTSFTDGTLSVTPRAITLAANDATKMFGAPFPVLSATVTGGSLAPFHTAIAEAFPGFTVTSTATRTTQPGLYPIAVAAANSNYDLSVRNGTLTISPLTSAPFAALELLAPETRSWVLFDPIFGFDPWSGLPLGPGLGLPTGSASSGQPALNTIPVGCLVAPGPDCRTFPHPANIPPGAWLSVSAQ